MQYIVLELQTKLLQPPALQGAVQQGSPIPAHPGAEGTENGGAATLQDLMEDLTQVWPLQQTFSALSDNSKSRYGMAVTATFWYSMLTHMPPCAGPGSGHGRPAGGGKYASPGPPQHSE
jgi:hypothetical protein